MRNILLSAGAGLLLLLAGGCCSVNPNLFMCDVIYSPALAFNVSGQQEDSEYPNGDNAILPGLQLGVYTQLPLNDQLGFNSGLLLSTRGGRSSYSYEEEGLEESYSFSSTTRLSYLDLPLQAQLNLGSTGFHLFGGFQPSLLLGASNRVKEGGNTSRQGVRSQFSGFDLAGSLGAGYALDNGLLFSLGYHHGLVDVRAGQNFGSKLRNRSLALMVAYRLQ